MAEIDLSVLARQCLNRRIPDKEVLSQEVSAWQEERNDEVFKVRWQFTTADAYQVKAFISKDSDVTLY